MTEGLDNTNFFKVVNMYRITECTHRLNNIVSTMYFGFENRTKKRYTLDKVNGLLDYGPTIKLSQIKS